MKLKGVWGWLKDHGISISYSDGPAFNPELQERTDAMVDIRKNKDKRKAGQDNGKT